MIFTVLLLCPDYCGILEAGVWWHLQLQPCDDKQTTVGPRRCLLAYSDGLLKVSSGLSWCGRFELQVFSHCEKMDEIFLALEQGRMSSTTPAPSPGWGWRGAVESHIAGLQSSVADTIWTSNFVPVQFLQLFLHLTARDRQVATTVTPAVTIELSLLREFNIWAADDDLNGLGCKWWIHSSMS